MASKQTGVLPEYLIELLRDTLTIATLPVTFGEIKSILLQVDTPQFEEFTRLRDSELQKLLDQVVGSGDAVFTPDGRYHSCRTGWEGAEPLVHESRYAKLPQAISRTLPPIGVYGSLDRSCLQRDLCNAFWWNDGALLQRCLTIIANNLRDETDAAHFFEFLLRMPQEWLLALPERLLCIAAQRMLPICARDLLDGRPLLNQAYRYAENAGSKVVCAMLDYAILIGDWQKVQPLLNRLPNGSAARLTRVAWCRFIQGQDEAAACLYLDALTTLRRDERDHNTYFRTIGGLFMPMSAMRRDDENSLAMALSCTDCARRISTDFSQVYNLLYTVIRNHCNVGLPPESASWHASSPLSNLFCGVAEYWLTGQLTAAQQELFDQAAALARQNGYLWLAEECDEMNSRMTDFSPAGSHRWHDLRNSRMPFMLDCMLNRNSWVERMTRMEQSLGQMTPGDRRRLAWAIALPSAEHGLITVKPVEQHHSRNHWSKGRRYTAYRTQHWENIGQDEQQPISGLELSAQDKYVCYLLRSGEEFLAANPECKQRVWAQILQALANHPRLFIEGAENRTIRCVCAAPRVHITAVGDNYRYALYPESHPGDNAAVVLENGDRLCIYEFDEAARQLRELFGEDFQVPSAYTQENIDLITRLAHHCCVVSDFPLPLTETGGAVADSTPCIRMLPSTHGLQVELLVCPFAATGTYYKPGEGPMEIISAVGGELQRHSRNPEAELAAANAIMEKCPALAAVPAEGQTQKWEWLLNANAAYEFTMQLRDIAAGCRIQWPEDQKFVCRRTLTLGNVSLRTNSYQDWFGVNGEVKLEDSEGTISLYDLIQSAVIDHKRFIALSDGQVVALSDSLRKNLEELSRMGELVGGSEKGQLRISPFLISFAGHTMGNFGHSEISRSCEEWLQTYSAAMQAPHALPATLNASLRSYQEEGFLWMSRLDAIHAGACLADDMGLGKTVQAISMILSCAAEGPALIVAPTSVCPNWQAELSRFAPSLECEIFGPGDRVQAFRRMQAGRVMITSYGLLQSEQNAFRNMHWRIAVLDEAQAIKNSHAKRSRAALSINADFRLVTTGTPVENNLNELWSIFNFIIPGLLGSRENFQRKYAIPIETSSDEAAHGNDGQRKSITAQLRTLISPFLLRRRKEQVLTELPPKEDIDYYIDLSEPERAFYDKLRRSIAADLEREGDSENQRNERVLCGITMLREAVDHPAMVEGAGGDGLPSSKLEAFLELLKGVLSNDHKVLVFSQFTKFLDIVCRALDENSIRYGYLDGSMSQTERRRAVEEFQNGNVPVFVSSLKAGCLGLNLTQADYVIHLDSWWNPAVENQASDRAYRLGQKKPVTIYHLRVRNTIDEKIRQLHGHKQNLADQMLENSDDLSNKATMEEIRRILCEE